METKDPVNDAEPGTTVSRARKKLIAFIVVGVLLLALAPAIPGLVDRYHIGSSQLGNRIEWRALVVGLILIVAPTYVLIKFRHEKD